MGKDTKAGDDQRFQRKTVLVKRALQLKYIGMVFLSVLVASMIVGGDVYYSLMRVMLTECPSVTDRVVQFNTVLLVKIALYLGLMLLISLYVSHRFAGPIYRFEKSCQSLSTGDLTHRVSLRTGDELMELQEEFNGMAAALQALLQKDRNLAQRLSERVEEIAKRLPEGAGSARDDLKALKLELDHLTKSFKV
ncbi:MAG: methyl-accepting chemotaxis protein [Elusimicrobia bacterium]|nr:methyl-accepting chemotaxis protein [Elusimicrobiota bacterium]